MTIPNPLRHPPPLRGRLLWGIDIASTYTESGNGELHITGPLTQVTVSTTDPLVGGAVSRMQMGLVDLSNVAGLAEPNTSERMTAVLDALGPHLTIGYAWPGTAVPALEIVTAAKDVSPFRVGYVGPRTMVRPRPGALLEDRSGMGTSLSACGCPRQAILHDDAVHGIVRQVLAEGPQSADRLARWFPRQPAAVGDILCVLEGAGLLVIDDAGGRVHDDR